MNKYPYTDFHELNADYLLQRLKDVEAKLDTIKEDIESEVLAWVQEQLVPYEQQLNELITEVQNLERSTQETLAQYDTRINTFINQVNAQIVEIRTELVNSINAVNALTDLKIEQNNIYLLNEITENVGDLFVVLNPFTGETVTIQDMVDYLSAFHINDAIDYDTMATRALTYNQFEALNITYTDLTLHGNTLYV
ncbi:MAG: hypothetical protein J6Q39_00425 [Bacteroidales bacterium]|nr:hypothetical protein [Bacteroidales bacterium]